jgi:hypothetical protein
VPEHHAGLSVEAGKTADDALVIGERAVAVQLLELGEKLGDVIQRVRRSISSEMSTADSFWTNRNSSIFDSNSEIGCSNSR